MPVKEKVKQVCGNPELYEINVKVLVSAKTMKYLSREAENFHEHSLTRAINVALISYADREEAHERYWDDAKQGKAS